MPPVVTVAALYTLEVQDKITAQGGAAEDRKQERRVPRSNLLPPNLPLSIMATASKDQKPAVSLIA